MTLPASVLEIILSYYLDYTHPNKICILAKYNKQALNHFISFELDDFYYEIFRRIELSHRNGLKYKNIKKCIIYLIH